MKKASFVFFLFLGNLLGGGIAQNVLAQEKELLPPDVRASQARIDKWKVSTQAGQKRMDAQIKAQRAGIMKATGNTTVLVEGQVKRVVRDENKEASQAAEGKESSVEGKDKEGVVEKIKETSEPDKVDQEKDKDPDQKDGVAIDEIKK